MLSFKLLDFKVDDEDIEGEERMLNKQFIIQVFGIDEAGDRYTLFIEDFKPYFYVKVGDWTDAKAAAFIGYIKQKIGTYYAGSIDMDYTGLVLRHKLYGFDNGRRHKFVKMVFNNLTTFNKVKNLFYTKEDRHLVELPFGDTKCSLYEANIPPLLRFFHERDISPSGWVKIKQIDCEVPYELTTAAKYEYMVSYKKIHPDHGKEAAVPYNICSFDIEASSSHGDFPVPVKNYKKLAGNLLDQYDEDVEIPSEWLYDMIAGAFGILDNPNVELVYPMKPVINIDDYHKELLTKPARKIKQKTDAGTVLSMFEGMDEILEEGAEEFVETDEYKPVRAAKHTTLTLLDILADKSMTREDKMNEITYILDNVLPRLKGDQITYIGSSFWRYGADRPHLQHCLVLGGSHEVRDTVIVECRTEKELILKWSELIRDQDPDIITGYNIFGFDYKFMYYRARECGCLKEFLKLSRNHGEVCGKWNGTTYEILESSITLASGTYNLSIIRMNGRIQIDLFNYFRREYQLPMYKLDFVAGYFIGDKVSGITNDGERTTITSRNLSGLQIGNYINFEESSHSTDYYEGGRKFEVVHVGVKNFTIQGIATPNVGGKTVKWCLAKDDVSPQDIFRMWRGSDADRAVIAKYCIQDCNLVHHLTFKIDIITGYVEMAKICSVPLDFLVMRGQGIKLFSFVAKECMKKETLIPVLEKKHDGGYEGAIVLPPKCGLYIDEPVAVVDYNSLYPSSMISENYSHDSKVWTKEYNLKGELIKETGEKKDGIYIYDNLPQYTYVNIQYDTYEYRVLREGGKAEKIKVGYKVCRWVQLPDGENSIIPSILKELLYARKYTRTIAKYKTVRTATDEYIGLMDDLGDSVRVVMDKTKQKVLINKVDIIECFDTYNDFMKNVLDKRQLAIKVTANSVYGQCGAITSPFYEKDVAASTTATGRQLLVYGKTVIESVFGDRICNTSYGIVHSHAEYIYGDSVASYTPVYIRHHGIVEIIAIQDLEKFGKWVQYREDKEACHLEGVETWSDTGWTPCNTVIRHKLVGKKMYRVRTSMGLVDATSDHSLLDIHGKEITPESVEIGTELLHHRLPDIDGIVTNSTYSQLEAAISFAVLQSWGIIPTINETDGKYTVDEIDEEDYRVCSIKEIEYDGYVYDLTTENHHFSAGIGSMVVHNTDSIFMSFKLTDLEGNKIVGKEALKITIELAKEAGELATKFLKQPHNLDYEKTFMPFCLLSKKRYVGMLYEDNPDKCYRKSMGIVLKRRDNAPIVKDVYGGIIDLLMSGKTVTDAIEFTKRSLAELVDGLVPLDKLIITKSLKGFYKNPHQIAHKVLADKIAKRDAGNKPAVGDRIPFVYCQLPATKKKILQGERVEHPDYMRLKGLKPDYEFYITRQIMIPVQQIFALVLEHIPEYDKRHLDRMYKALKEFKRKQELPEGDEKLIEKERKLRNVEVRRFLFDDILLKNDQKKTGQSSITKFFKAK
jgi:DNA polymerase elongation subunit (family B)